MLCVVHDARLPSTLLYQKSEQAILGNSHGSSRYISFLRGLGHLVRLANCDKVYLGGMDVAGGDGELACIWHDEITQGLVGTLCDCRQTDSHDILEAHCFVVDNEQMDLEHVHMYVCSRFVLNLLLNFTSQN